VPIAGELQMKGDIEPLVSRAYSDVGGFGRSVEAFGLHWMPGSILTADAELIVGPYGVLSSE
jgi:hypothetical protein